MLQQLNVLPGAEAVPEWQIFLNHWEKWNINLKYGTSHSNSVEVFLLLLLLLLLLFNRFLAANDCLIFLINAYFAIPKIINYKLKLFLS